MEEIGAFMECQENKGGNYLYHELIADHLLYCQSIPHATRLIKQPAADKEETRHTQEEQHIVECHEIFFEAKNADMRIDDENHGESSHRINVFNSFLCHFRSKDKKIIDN